MKWGASVLVSMCMLSGCALTPDEVRLEHLHASHLSVHGNDEDSLDIIQGVARYEFGHHAFVEVGCGIKIRDAGFYGPNDVCTTKGGLRYRPKGGR